MVMIPYRCSCDRRYVDKASYLTSISTIVSGTMRDDTDIINPTLRVQIERIDFNYVYIRELNRYYFVENAIYVANNLWDVELHCDVLYTYKSAILSTSAFVERSYSDNNPSIEDSRAIILPRQTVTTHDFTDGGDIAILADNGGSYTAVVDVFMGSMA